MGIFPVGVKKSAYISKFPRQNRLETESTQECVFSTIDKSENFLHILSQKDIFQRLNREMTDFYTNECTENLVIPIGSLNIANGLIKQENTDGFENEEFGIPVAVKFRTGSWHRGLLLECRITDKKKVEDFKEELEKVENVEPTDWKQEIELIKNELAQKSGNFVSKKPKLRNIFKEPDSQLNLKIKMIDFGNTDWVKISTKRFQKEIKALAPRFVQDLPPFAYSCEFFSTSQKKENFIEIIEQVYKDKQKQRVLEAITCYPFKVEIEGVNPENNKYIVTAKYEKMI